MKEENEMIISLTFLRLKCFAVALRNCSVFFIIIWRKYISINPKKMSVTVLGGGIAGLSSAFYLATRNNIPKIRLYEVSSRISGWINSDNHNGYCFESSARTLRPKGLTGNTTLELVQLLGLENKIVPITSDRVAGKFRLTWSKNKLNVVTPEIDNDLKKLFSAEGSDNESIYDFTVKRFNKELADYVISPMVSGICAGDAREISASFLVKGQESTPFEQNELYKKARNERWTFYSFEGGIETLPKAILSSLTKNDGVSLNMDSNCKKIHFEEDGTVKVTVNSDVHTTSHVISALPSYRLAPLLEHQHPELANDLKQLKHADVAMVNLHFEAEDLLKEKGFGVFVPSIENSQVLGITFDSWFINMKGTSLTVMIGGNQLTQDQDEKKLLEIALKSVKEILNISEKPDNFKVNVMRKSFPQYTVGHYQRLDRIKNYIKAHNLPLSLCGQSYDGIGINEVILSSKLAAQSVKI